MSSVVSRTDITCFRGRVGLAGILKAIGLNRGDEVITQAFTCVAVPEGIIAGGGVPVFADIDESSVNVDIDCVEKMVNKRTKAIVVQHTFGYAGPVAEISEIAKDRGISVIEDCCHTFRTELNGKLAGEIGDAAFYSLEWGKPLPCGVGGVVAVNNEELRVDLLGWQQALRSPSAARTLRLELQYLAFSLAYRPSTYWPVKALFNALSRSGAAEGNFNDLSVDTVSEEFDLGMCTTVARRFRRKQKEIDAVASHARKVVDIYRGMELQGGLSRVKDDVSEGCVLARYPLWSDSKADMLEAAKASNVELADWYKTPVHPLVGEQQAAVNYKEGGCPVAEEACRRIVSLPTNRGVDRRFLAKVERLLSAASRPA